MVGRTDVANASISLFSSAGIGDLGIEYGCKIPVILSAELNEKRADLISSNYPEGTVIRGDIVKTKGIIISSAKKILAQKRPLLVTLSPPCQGMSTNGAGKISAQVKKGKRPKYDERNKLLIPGLEIVKSLQPEYFLIENVPNMKNTVIMWKRKKTKRLIEIIPITVGKGYSIISFVQDFTKYGVPHNRKRLITIGKRTNQSTSTIEILNSPPEWFDSGSFEERMSVRNAIGTISRTRKFDPLHLMPKMNDRHKEWIRHIPKNSGKTAHFNACDNNKCGNIDEFKVVICTKCGENLPRPFVENDGVRRAIKGYKTSYRRMLPNAPANTITMNSGVVSSDVKIHYNQDRVLTLLEILILSTVYEIPNSKFRKTYAWNEKYSFSEIMKDSDYLLQKNIIRQALGESIPPLAMQRMVSSLIKNWP